MTAGDFKFVHISECLDEAMREIERDRSDPLVVVLGEDADRISFRFRDRSMPNFGYEFWCLGPADAIHWIAHLAEKSWVTTRHLEIFARHVTARWVNRSTGEQRTEASHGSD